MSSSTVLCSRIGPATSILSLASMEMTPWGAFGSSANRSDSSRRTFASILRGDPHHDLVEVLGLTLVEAVGGFDKEVRHLAQ